MKLGIGARLVSSSGGEYLLASMGINQVGLINLEKGYRWDDAILVGDADRLTQEEYDSLRCGERFRDLNGNQIVIRKEFETVVLNDEYTATVYPDRVQVGCQTFPVSVLRQLLTAVESLGNGLVESYNNDELRSLLDRGQKIAWIKEFRTRFTEMGSPQGLKESKEEYERRERVGGFD